MAARVLIVEDEMLVAMEMEAAIEDLGFEPVGIAADTTQALQLAEGKPDIALVDLNLRDGLTGPDIGKLLAQRGVHVVFLTANPRIVANGVPGALGVCEKPASTATIASILAFAAAIREGSGVEMPLNFIRF
jgi:DNA-binding NarL/FixJ family response regulator